MSSSEADATIAYQQVMEHTGFYRHGEPTPGVIDAKSLRAENQIDKIIKYSTVINENKINARSIFELSGSPCIYFTQLNESYPSGAEIHRLQKLAWNHGLAPMLWIVTPAQILIYNCYSKPSPSDVENPKRHLLRLFRQTEAGLKQLKDFASRFEFVSGNFWQRREARKINRGERVDSALLVDLEEAEKQLGEAQLDRNVAHALLGRSIFVSYLQDRGILTPKFFQRYFGVQKFTDALATKSLTYDVFKWVRKTFNGDLFPLTYKKNGQEIHEENIVDEYPHLSIIRELLLGTEMASGQGRLWPYEFDVIPIELISSIYEKFAHADDPKTAKERSTHYTPINLVDMVLSQIFEGLPAEAKLGDLSCGSGVFLVESLRRLVSRRLAAGEEHSREVVRNTLYNQIYGVDISAEAIQIAAFSLYLAVLELDPNPQPPEDLSFLPLLGKNLFIANAFNTAADFNKQEPFVSKSFGAIIGNPPWKRTKTNSLALKYCKDRGYPLALNTPDQAFLWRIGDFTNRDSLIGLVLHGKPFFSKTKAALEAKEALIKRYKPRIIINLSDLRKDGLFPKAKAPALVLIAESCEAEQGDSFTFVKVERSGSFKRHGIIEIGPENIKRMSTYRIASDQDLLKVASWGSPRDMALIERIRDDDKFLTLRNFASSQGWARPGRGVEPGGSVNLDKLKDKLPKKYLPSGTMPRFSFKADDLPDRPQSMRVRRGHSRPEIYLGPLLICTRGIKIGNFYAAVVKENILYTEEYIGFSTTGKNSEQLHYLNAILNSSLANYFLFLTASVWGVERDKVEIIDLLHLPVPDLNKINGDLVQDLLKCEEILGLDVSNQDQGQSFLSDLDQAVFDLYDLNSVERILVQDTVNLTIDLHTRRERSIAFERPDISELKAYALQLMGVLQPFLNTLNESAVIAEVINVGAAPLQVIKFSIVDAGQAKEPISIVDARGLESVLNNIAENLPERLADYVYVRRVLRIYADNDFYVVKPSQRRYWSRSAGLNDGDAVIAEHIGADNGAFQTA